MQDDPVQYWQDLTANYRQMSDRELLELAAKPEDLTEVAQQVLRDEMKLRNLDRRPSSDRWLPRPVPRKHVDLVSGDLPHLEDAPSDPADTDERDLPPHEYTWKTWLCDCESNEHAWQVFLTLKRHGIESWVRAVSPASMDMIGPQVHVAADQLEAAQAVIALPIPQDIIDDVNTEVPDFEIPTCPRCGSNEGVVLDSTEPANAWLCEACGAEWKDAEPTAENAGEGKSLPS